MCRRERMAGGGRGAPEVAGGNHPLLLASKQAAGRGPAEDWATAYCQTSVGSLLHTSRSAQALARLSTGWARTVRAYPRCILATGLLVATVAAAGGCLPLIVGNLDAVGAPIPHDVFLPYAERADYCVAPASSRLT